MNLFIVILVSLCLGSFLNVVIYRLPIMLKQLWQAECALLNHQSLNHQQSINLCLPASHCPHCAHHLRWQHNIPIISFILLKGRCAFCQQSIGYRYVLIEIASALLSIFLYEHFHGLTIHFFASSLFTLWLIALIAIDIDHQLLPDELTLSLLWLGLLFSLNSVFITTPDAIIGAMSGYVSLTLVAYSYRKITGRIGLGGGDSKLYAAIGAWVGWQLLPIVILLACIAGLLIGGVLIWQRGGSRYTPFAFGPYLASAAWIILLWQPSLLR